jgi:pumilio RNA-binding family
LKFSTHKFASNVVEKCFLVSSPADRVILYEEVCNSSTPSGEPILMAMMKDQYANYVVQKMLDIADDKLRGDLVAKILPMFPLLRKFTYGKHIISKIEKLNLVN